MDAANELRLERFDLFAGKVRAELAQTTATLERLKAEGKARTATYQQLWSNSMVLRQIVSRLEEVGL